MKSWEAVRLVAGSALVYGLVAACGAATDSLEARGRDDAGDTDDPEREGGGSLLDAIADAITDPVKDADAEQPISGSRLKAEYLRGADGSRQFLQWFDIVRQEPCSYLKDSAGDMRCMPIERLMTDPVNMGWPEESSCSEAPTIVSLPPGYSSRYAFIRAADGGHRLYGLTPYTGLLKSRSLGVCTAESSVPAGVVRYRLGVELAPTEFVKATVERD